MGQENAARRRLVIIELREERAQHLARLERAVGTREVGAVAPILPGTEEKHLHARVAALLMNGEHVGFIDAARIDALMRLHRRERRKAVAIDRRTFEIERIRRLLHFARELLLYGAALAGEEQRRLAHELGVALVRDLAGARRRATLDLMQQARPRAAFVYRIGARADEKRAFQRGNRPVNRLRRGEGPVILSRSGTRAAVLGDHWRRLARRDQDV